MTWTERASSLIIMILASVNVGIAVNASIGTATFGLLVVFANWVEVLKR